MLSTTIPMSILEKNIVKKEEIQEVLKDAVRNLSDKEKLKEMEEVCIPLYILESKNIFIGLSMSIEEIEKFKKAVLEYRLEKKIKLEKQKNSRNDYYYFITAYLVRKYLNSNY